MASLDPVVEVQDLTFGYEGSEVILDRVQLEIGSSDFLAVIGPNGGGKTTLIKAILGLVKPQQGAYPVSASTRAPATTPATSRGWGRRG